MFLSAAIVWQLLMKIRLRTFFVLLLTALFCANNWSSFLIVSLNQIPLPPTLRLKEFVIWTKQRVIGLTPWFSLIPRK